MAAKLEDNPKKRLREYLPAIYQEEPEAREEAAERNFLNDFLFAFEAVLLSPMQARHHGSAERITALKEEVERLPDLLDPKKAPEEFLPWLAGWAALNLRADLSVDKKRELIAKIIPLYRFRGTRAYLEKLLTLYLDFPVRVNDAEAPALQVGVHSSAGRDTQIGGGPPYFFHVTVTVPREAAEAVESYSQLAHSVIQLAKPAHTYYELEFATHHTQREAGSGKGNDDEIGGRE